MTRTAYELSDWQGYLSRGEVDLLKELAVALPPRPIIVNIGAGAGTSTLAFLEARDDSIVISIDVLTNEQEVTTNEHLRLKEIEPEDAARVIRIWGDSVQVGKAWPFGFVDMVFVDGDHSEAGCRADIEAWMPHATLMAFHDYGSPRWGGVKGVVDRMMAGWEQVGHRDTVIAFEA